MQDGGFLTFRPLTISQSVQPGAAETKETPADKKEKFIFEETMKTMIDKGITSDVMQYANIMEDAATQYESMSNLDKQSNRGRQLKKIMSGDPKFLVQLVRNKEYLDTGRNTVKANRAESELAINANGMLVFDNSTKKTLFVSPEELAGDMRGDKKYRALTNSEAARIRENLDTMAGDVSVPEALSSSIGFEQIKDEVAKSLQTLGSESFENKVSGQIRKAANDLQEQAISGIYDVTRMTGTTSNKRNLEAAQDAMWSMLSSNAKSALKARAVAMGVNPNQLDEAARTIAMSFLAPKLTVSNKAESSEKLDTSLMKAIADEKTEDLGYWSASTIGTAPSEKVSINMGGGHSIEANASSLGGIQVEGKLIGTSTVESFSAHLGNVSDIESAYIGNSKVSEKLLKDVIYRGGTDMTKIVLPAKRHNDGTVSPDFDLAKRFDEAEKELSKYGGSKAPSAKRKEVYEKYDIEVDSNGSPKTTQAEFLSIPVYTLPTVSDIIDKNKDNKPFLSKVSDDEKDSIKSSISDALTKGSDTKQSRKEADKRLSPNWFGNDINSAMLYLPVKSNMQKAMMADKGKVTGPKGTGNVTTNEGQATFGGMRRVSNNIGTDRL